MKHPLESQVIERRADKTSHVLFEMIERRLAQLEAWEDFFATMVDKNLIEYRGALYQCHNERFFLTQLRNGIKK